MKNLNRQLAKNARYAAAPGAPYNDDEAQIVGQELERINRSGQSLTPENVVESATSPDSPLHRFFTWDDALAAYAWRKQEARLVVNHLMVVVSHGDEPVAVRAHFSVTQAEHGNDEEPAQEYVSVRAVMGDKAMRSQLKRQAIREFQSLSRKYQNLGFDEFQAVYQAVDALAD